MRDSFHMRRSGASWLAGGAEASGDGGAPVTMSCAECQCRTTRIAPVPAVQALAPAGVPRSAMKMPLAVTLTPAGELRPVT
jgi:hypothetical protein